MSDEADSPVSKDDEGTSETNENTTTAEIPVPPESTESAPTAPSAEPEIPQEPTATEPEVVQDVAETEAAPEAAAVTTEAPAPPPPAPEPAGSSTTLAKADVGKRIVAALIDFAIAFVMILLPGVGQLLAAGYLLLRDGLELDFMNHRSIGKKVMKLHLESVEGQPLELITSVKRNWIFAIGPLVLLLFFIPILGWLMLPFALFAAIALGITELVLALTDADGRRLGDKWAGTIVVED